MFFRTQMSTCFPFDATTMRALLERMAATIPGPAASPWECEPGMSHLGSMNDDSPPSPGSIGGVRHSPRNFFVAELHEIRLLESRLREIFPQGIHNPERFCIMTCVSQESPVRTTSEACHGGLDR